MSKKWLSLILLFASCLALTGCTEVIDLTDTETRLISEYAAELLLKHDVNFDDRLNEGEKLEEEMLSEAEELSENTSETATTQEEPVTEEAATESNTGRNLDNMIDEVTEESESEAVGTESDIAKILGLEGLSITYKDYIVSDHYPATDEEGEFIYLDATEGYQLLVVRFNVSNTSSDVVNFTMLDESIDYRIICNGSHAANPMLTILMNDLGTMESTLNPEETQEAVLVFQISNDMQSKLETMELKVDYNNVENVITIL